MVSRMGKRGLEMSFTARSVVPALLPGEVGHDRRAGTLRQSAARRESRRRSGESDSNLSCYFCASLEELMDYQIDIRSLPDTSTVSDPGSLPTRDIHDLGSIQSSLRHALMSNALHRSPATRATRLAQHLANE